MVARALGHSTQEAKAGVSLLKASLLYRVSSRPAKSTKQNPVLKINQCLGDTHAIAHALPMAPDSSRQQAEGQPLKRWEQVNLR